MADNLFTAHRNSICQFIVEITKIVSEENLPPENETVLLFGTEQRTYADGRSTGETAARYELGHREGFDFICDWGFRFPILPGMLWMHIPKWKEADPNIIHF